MKSNFNKSRITSQDYHNTLNCKYFKCKKKKKVHILSLGSVNFNDVYQVKNEIPWRWIIINKSILTAAKWSHLSILRVDLWNISNSLTQHVHWNLVTVLVLPVGRLVASSLNLGPAVSCGRDRSVLKTRRWLFVSKHQLLSYWYIHFSIQCLLYMISTDSTVLMVKLTGVWKEEPSARVNAVTEETSMVHHFQIDQFYLKNN